MNRHVGASFTLSVLVVVFFAVILYEPEHARLPARPSRHTSASTRETPPAPTPGVPISEATSAPPPESLGQPAVASAAEPFEPPADPSPPRRFPLRSAEPRPLRSPVARAAPRLPQPASDDLEAGTRPRIRKTARRQSLSTVPRPAFTRVAAGESLSDVAVRVYGTPDAASTLWLVNRDLIDRRDAPLTVGMLLRTP